MAALLRYPMLQTPLAKASALLTAVVVAWAFARGRWPERIAAAAIGVDWIGGTVFQDRRLHHHGQPVMVVLDIAQALVLLGLALGCRRTWVLWGAAMACLLTLTHLVFGIDPRFGQWSYLTALYVWTVGLLVALGAGAAFEGRRPAEVAPWITWGGRLMAARPSTPSARARRRS